MLDITFASCIACLGSTPAVLIIAISCFLAINRPSYAHLISLLLFIICLSDFLTHNALTKQLQGLCKYFPAEIVILNIALYGWIALYNTNKLYQILASSLLLVMVGYVAYSQHYNVYDIILNVLFGSILVLAYNYLSTLKIFTTKPYFLSYILCAIGLLAMWFNNWHASVNSYIAMSSLIGFTLSWSVFAQKFNAAGNMKIAGMGLLCLYGVYNLILLLHKYITDPYQLAWALLGVMIPIIAYSIRLS